MTRKIKPFDKCQCGHHAFKHEKEEKLSSNKTRGCLIEGCSCEKFKRMKT